MFWVHGDKTNTREFKLRLEVEVQTTHAGTFDAKPPGVAEGTGHADGGGGTGTAGKAADEATTMGEATATALPPLDPAAAAAAAAAANMVDSQTLKDDIFASTLALASAAIRYQLSDMAELDRYWDTVKSLSSVTMQHEGTARNWQQRSKQNADADGGLARSPSHGSLRLSHALVKRVPELVAAYSWHERSKAPKNEAGGGKTESSAAPPPARKKQRKKRSDAGVK